jgi:O-antigen/teichoic acid export membrane protein
MTKSASASMLAAQSVSRSGVGVSLWNAVRSRWERLARDTMFRKSMISILDQAVVSGMNFAITIILSRSAGKAETGLYYLALQLVFFLRGVQDQLIGAPYMVYSNRKSAEKASSYAGSSLVHELLLLTLAATALGVTSAWGGCSSELSDLLWLLVLAAPLMLLREFIRQITFADLRVVEALLLDVAVVALQLTGLLVAWHYDCVTTFLTYAILAGGCGVVLLYWLLVRRGTFAPSWQHVQSDWISNWQFGKWSLATQLLGCSMPFVIPWVVAITHGAEATGAFGVGTTLIGLANMFVLGMSNFVCPQAARAYASGGKQALTPVLRRAGELYLFVLGSFTLMMICFGDVFMTWVYGPEFSDAGRILAILAVGSLANSLGIVAGNGLWAMERPAANFRADLCAMFTWIAATLLLVGAWGPLGAAVASVLGTAVSAAVRMFTLSRELRTA